MNKKGILLVNLGTPDSPSVRDVRKYLREFLMDARVIDIPYIFRWLLVNVIIAVFRSPKSAKEYQKLWTERGSPLKFYGQDLAALVQEKLGSDYHVALAMRYQSPSIQEGLLAMKAAGVHRIHVIPLFPQYASATTGSVIEKTMRLVQGWQVIPNMTFETKFLHHPKLIEAFAAHAQRCMQKTTYDHFVFSYHGLPERQIYKAGLSRCQLDDCSLAYGQDNRYCYRAQCFETTRLIAERLGLPPDRVTTSFQSRLGKDPWIKPYTEQIVHSLAQAGKKRVLAFSPAFVADCLETTIEVGETYKEEFIAAGGEQWDLVESLNRNEKWVECLVDLAQRRLG